MATGPIPQTLSQASVICCPYAGGSSQAYRRWADMDGGIDVVALDYPGRLLRDGEPMLRTVGELADALYDEIANRLQQPFALVGSSLGALVAFELARRAEAQGCRPAVITLCACSAPGRTRTPLSRGDDQSFVARIIERYGGKMKEVASNPHVRSVLLPIMRADVEAYEAYAESAPGPISADMIVVRGEQDEAVTLADALGWRAYSQGSVEVFSVPGDHFFVEARPNAVIAELRARLRAALNCKSVGR